MGFVDFTHCFASTDCQKTCKNVIVLVPTDDCSVHHRSQCKVLFESCEGHGKGNLNTSFGALPSQHPSCTLDHSCWQWFVWNTASRRHFVVCGINSVQLRFHLWYSETTIFRCHIQWPRLKHLDLDICREDGHHLPSSADELPFLPDSNRKLLGFRGPEFKTFQI